MKLAEWIRFYRIVSVLLTYGLDELLPDRRLVVPLKFARRLLFWVRNQHRDKSLGERLRLALQELGPVWIKFGQMLSTRRDLFPSEVADQLALLQDRVASFSGALARKEIELATGKPLESWIDDFDPEPLASASIAQVHTGCLKNGQEVVLKVIRPDILPVIKADTRLMFRLAGWLPSLLPDGRRLRAQEVVADYEKSLVNELNLMREAANAIQLKRNFEQSPLLYIPEVYTDYCRENVLVMERIYGIPIANITDLESNKTNMKLLAERGVQVFFTQVFRDSFFHADMHPGNIFVSRLNPQEPQYIAVDFGIVGSLNKEDKRYLAENFIAFFNRDYRRVAELHVDSGWVPSGTNIEEFEFAIRTVCEPIFKKPLAEISFGHVLLNLFETARNFNMEVQPQLVLLQKTLLYVEGLGRQLYPQLDLWTTAKPFLESWLKNQVGWPALWRVLREKGPFWLETFPELPELIYHSLQQNNQQGLHKAKNEQRLLEQQIRHRQAAYGLAIGITLVLGAVVLFINQYRAEASILLTMSTLAWFVGWRRLR